MDSSNKNKTIIILLGIFSLMLVMNILMPLHRDDFDYSVIWHTQAHVGSLQDVIASCWNHYLLHGGRMVTVFGLVLFLFLGKLWFDIANAVIFTGFVVLIYMHARRYICGRASVWHCFFFPTTLRLQEKRFPAVWL